MATFTFGRTVDIHWNGFEVVGPAGTVFSIPDQLYEEFNDDILPVEPTLTWIDTNEFLTLSNSVSVTTLEGTIPISITTTTSGRNVSISSSTNPAGYNLVADGSGGVIFQAASTGALTSIVGVAPMSTIISGNTASVILNASYQTAGTYVNAVIGTSPASVLTASGTSTITINQAAITGATAATNAQVVRFYVKNTTGSTIPKGSAVYVSGATGDNALISLASATSDPSSSKTLGITSESIANDAFGYVVEAGYLTDIDTSATTAGASVWLGNTPGSLVFVSPPAEPSHAVYLGVVVRVQAINGSILVKVQNGYELDELHDVFVGGVSTALPLVYNSTSSGWVAQALTSVGIADNAVVAAKIDAGAVTSAKIAAGAVGSAALADNAVVAAKIAAGSVGSAALASGAVNSSNINSGAATSGQILQANGSGGVSFSTLIAGVSISASTVSGSVYNHSLTNISFNSATGNQFLNKRPIAVHPTSAIIYQFQKTSNTTNFQLLRIDTSTYSVLNTWTLTMSDAGELPENMEFGNGNLCIATSGGGFCRWLIINGSTGSTLASGNIANVGTSPSVGALRYDENANQFVIHGNVTTGGNGRSVFRFIDASTYTTKVHTFNFGSITKANNSATSVSWGSNDMGCPLWLSGPQRWVIFHPYDGGDGGGGMGQAVFISASTATVDHLTLTGKVFVDSQTQTHTGDMGNASSNTSEFILSSSGTALLYAYAYGTLTNTRIKVAKIPLSSISSAYDSTVSSIPSGITSLSKSYSGVTGAAPQSPGNNAHAVASSGKVYFFCGYSAIVSDALETVSDFPHQVTSYVSAQDSYSNSNYFGMHTISGITYAYYYAGPSDYSILKVQLRSVGDIISVYNSHSSPGILMTPSASGPTPSFQTTGTVYQIAASTLTSRLVGTGGTVSIAISGTTSSTASESVTLERFIMR